MPALSHADPIVLCSWLHRSSTAWATQASPLLSSPLPLSRVGFFMQPPWKPDAPDATVAFVCDFFFFFFACTLTVGFFRGTSSLGQGWARKQPTGQPSCCSKATRISRIPCPKQLDRRGRDRLVAVRLAICCSGKASSPLHVAVASACPPTLTTQRVATAMATHKRAARSGSFILV